MRHKVDRVVGFQAKATLTLILAALLCLCPLVSFAQSILPAQWRYTPITSISSTAYSPDGTLMAVGGTGGIQIFTVSTGKLLRGLATSANNVNAVAFSKDGKSLAVGGTFANTANVSTTYTGTLEIWNVSTGKLKVSLGTVADSVNAVAFSPDGTTLVDGGQINRSYSSQNTAVLEVWNVSTGTAGASLSTAANVSVNSVSFSPDGASVAVGGSATTGGVLEIWKVTTATKEYTLNTAATSSIHSVAFSPDGSTLSDGGQSGSGLTTGVLELWNTANGKLIAALSPGANSSVNSVAFSPDGKSLLDGGSNGFGVLEIWNASTGTLVTTYRTSNPQVNTVAISPDGDTVADGGGNSLSNGVLELFDDSSGNLLAMLNTDAFFNGFGIPFSSAAFSPDGVTFAGGGQSTTSNGTVYSGLALWNLTTGAQGLALNTAATQVNSIAFSPDGKTLAVGGGSFNSSNATSAGVLELWSVSTGKLITRLSTAATYSVLSVAFSPDGSTLAVGGRSQNDGIAELWNVPNGKLIGTLGTGADYYGIASVAFSPDGKTLAVGGTSNVGTAYSGLLELWNVSAGTMIASLATSANNGVASVAFSPDGKTLAVGGSLFSSETGLGVLEMWNVSTQKRVATPSVSGLVASVGFSPDGRVLFVGDSSLEAFSTAGYALLGNYAASVKCFAASSSGALLAFGGNALVVAANPFYSTVAATSLVVSPQTVIGGTGSTGVVTLAQPAPSGGDSVVLTSSNTSVGVPPAVTVAPGATQATFAITTETLSSSATAVITANSAGTNVTASLNVSNLSVSGLALSPASVQGGKSSICKITLSGAAPSGGVTVSLVSSSGSAAIPATVSVSGGATTATFTVSTSPVSALAKVTITAGNGNASKSATLTVTPATIASFTLDPAKVGGGGNSTGTVTLSGPAGPSGILVTLVSSGSATIPQNLTIGAGQTVGTFTIVTYFVDGSSNQQDILGATLNGQVVTATLTMTPPGLTSVSVSPSLVSGGSNATGMVVLSGAAGPKGYVVSLSSSISSVVVPKSVTVASGRTDATFVVKTVAVSAQKVAKISARNGSATTTTSLTVTPPTLLSVGVSPATVAGGVSSVGTVTLSAVAEVGGMPVKLSSSTTSAMVPASVTIAAGKSSATFTVRTVAVSVQKLATISATLNGVSKTATLTINPPVLVSLSLKPTSVVGGKSSVGTVTISSVAPAGGMVISLSSSKASATVPTKVTIPAGRTSVTFTVKTVKVGSATAATITAGLGATSKTATLTIS